MLTYVCTLFIWFIIYSMLGWLIETTIFSISSKKFINRGFLNGPYCPIYGFGAIAIIIVVGNDTDNIVSLFATSALFACILEYITSWLMEKIFHARWWDYSEKPFNLNGRICLSNAIGFGLLGVLLMKVIQPTIAYFTDKIPENIIPYVALFSLICLLIDIIYTSVRFSKFNTKIALPPPEVYKKVNGQSRRLAKAFPTLESKKDTHIMHEIRQKASQKKPKTKAKTKKPK